MTVISATFGRPLFTNFGGLIIVDGASTAAFSLELSLVDFAFVVASFCSPITESFSTYET